MKKLSELTKGEIVVDFGKPQDVEFDGIVREGEKILPIIVNGEEYPTNVLHFSYDALKGSTKTIYKVDIKLAPEYKHKGIGYKIYKKFLMDYGNIVSPFSYRTNKEGEIEKIYTKLSNEPGVYIMKDPDFIFVCTEEWKSKYGTGGIYSILKRSPKMYIL